MAAGLVEGTKTARGRLPQRRACLPRFGGQVRSRTDRRLESGRSSHGQQIGTDDHAGRARVGQRAYAEPHRSGCGEGAQRAATVAAPLPSPSGGGRRARRDHGGGDHARQHRGEQALVAVGENNTNRTRGAPQSWWSATANLARRRHLQNYSPNNRDGPFVSRTSPGGSCPAWHCGRRDREYESVGAPTPE